MNVNFDILNELIEACEDWVGRGSSVCYITLIFFKTILFIKKLWYFVVWSYLYAGTKGDGIDDYTVEQCMYVWNFNNNRDEVKDNIP